LSRGTRSIRTNRSGRNRASGLWTIYWADSDAVRLDGGKVGWFNGDIGEFLAPDVFAGKNIVVKFHWDKRNPEAPVWSAAFSVDEGQTWEWNWYAHFARP
jgi:hypothetical protein